MLRTLKPHGKRQHIPMFALLGNYLDLLQKDIGSQEKTRPTLDSLSIMSHIPWRIHGAGILMLTWLGYIDGIHVTIYGSTMDYMDPSWVLGKWQKITDLSTKPWTKRSWKIHHWNFRLRDRQWTTTSKRCGRAEVVTNRGEVTVLRWNRRIGKTNHSTKIHRTWINWHLDLPWFSGFLPSGNLTVCYWKWSFIVSFPINSMVIFQ